MCIIAYVTSEVLKAVNSGCRWNRPSHMEGSCEHIEYEFADSRQGVVLQLRSWGAGLTILGRPRRRWEDNIKMGLGEIGFGDVDCIHLA
jgi:hypothetical protein